MAEWITPAQLEGDNPLNDLWVELEKDVRDDPEFQEIVGIDDATMLAHTNQAVKQHIQALSGAGGPLAMLSPDSWKQLYIMGFVVGVRFGRSNPLGESLKEPT